MKKLFLLPFILCFVVNSFSQTKGTFMDTRDAKVYKTIQIGTQTWLAENLAFKPDEGNFWTYNNDTSYVIKYGYLYDWETAKNVAPEGWHIPSLEEWLKLFDNFGGYEEVVGMGGAKKLISKDDWGIPNDTTIESGFNILPSGYRFPKDGLFEKIGTEALFWTSSTDPVYYNYDEAGSLRLITAGNEFYILYGPNNIKAGFSVRCIKD